MFPWTWSWAPQVHLPLSGNVAQRIDPVTHQFFQGIDPAAGNARIEERAFSVATYGTQLGLITEVLLDLAERSSDQRPSSPCAATALDKLRQVRDQIEAVKADEYAALCRDIEAGLATLKRQGGARFAELAERLGPLFDAQAA